MVGNTSQFQNVTPYNTEEHVTVGNEEGLNITTLVLLIFLVPILHHSIYHLSFMFHNSRLHQLCKDNNCLTIFYASGFCIQDKRTKTILLRGKCNQGLYPIHVAANHSSAVSPWNSSTPASTAYIGQQIFFVALEVRSSHQ